MSKHKEYDLFGNEILNEKQLMADFFGVAPFSILNTVDGDWQRRKKRWNALIQDKGQMRPDCGGGFILTGINGGTSILDAVLAEFMVKWFTEPGFKCFDPFAGDTVFGFVSGYLGRPFTGIELRKDQAEFNQAQCNREELPCLYINDSSENMDAHIEDNSMDFVFSCPPYADLEVYSDLAEDLSTMSHEDFFAMYKKILQNTFKKLKSGRFACITTSEVRDKKTGAYIQLVGKTIDIMVEAGYMYYNDIVLVNSVGTLPLRAGRQMNSARKIGRRHQNVLVFYKGNPKDIKQNFNKIIPDNEYYNNAR